MVTYEQIFEAFCKYAASREQGAWCDLWILCQRRMEALVKTKSKNLSVPLSLGDLADLITDSTARVMVLLKDANSLSPNAICGIFTAQNKKAFYKYNQNAKRWQYIRKVAGIMNIRFSQIIQELED